MKPELICLSFPVGQNLVIWVQRPPYDPLLHLSLLCNMCRALSATCCLPPCSKTWDLPNGVSRGAAGSLLQTHLHRARLTRIQKSLQTDPSETRIIHHQNDHYAAATGHSRTHCLPCPVLIVAIDWSHMTTFFCLFIWSLHSKCLQRSSTTFALLLKIKNCMKGHPSRQARLILPERDAVDLARWSHHITD